MGNEGIYPSDTAYIGILVNVEDQERIEEVIADARKELPDFDNLFEVIISDKQ